MRTISEQNGMSSGQAVIVPVTVLILIALSLVARGTQPVKTESQLARGLTISKQAGALADAGSEDLTYRIKRAKQYNTTEYVSLNDLISTTTVTTDPLTGIKTVLALGVIDDRLRQKSVSLLKGEQVEFNYAAQIGEGGLTLANSSSIVGNVYSNGPVAGSSESALGSAIGTIISAGPNGTVQFMHSTEDVYANSIIGSFVTRDAYYQFIMNTSVSGTSYPGSADKPTTTMPISDSLIADWEAAAEAGGISDQCVGGVYKIKDVSVTLGPIKIPCDLEVSGNSTSITLAGMVWVSGNVSIANSPVIRIDSGLGSNSVAIIADKISDRLNSSTFTVANSTTFTNSGTAGSFIFLISGNRYAEDIGGGDIVMAVNLANSASGEVVLYANHGKISITNSASLKSVTGYMVSVANYAVIIYSDGLASSLFTTGPGGSWKFNFFKETQ